MEFPKSVMTIKELGKMGFSEKRLRQIAQDYGFPIAFQEGGKTSPIKIDTYELLKFFKSQSKVRERG